MQVREESRAAFLRWRDQGDLAALAIVFDRTAQELLLVASHVAGAGQDPEDLLQQTFLLAIQKAERFDAARPLEPWLLGILVNVARSGRRRQQRERSGMEFEAGIDFADPVDEVLDREFATGLQNAIAGLPVPQREVMTLHLVHGLSAPEIAHATSRPLGTVKSWIHRSREEVQRRLPTGLVAAFTTLLRGMDQLGQVRTAVLAAAGAATTVAVAGNLVNAEAAGAVVRWPLWAALGLLSVVALGVWWSNVGAPPVPAVVPVATSEDRAAESPSTAADVAPPAMRDAPPVPPPATAPDTATLTIVGQRGGAPFPFGFYLTHLQLPDADLARVQFRVGSSGRHVIRGVPFGQFQLHTDRGEVRLLTVVTPEHTEVVAFDGGVEITGRVVDGRGNGVAGAEVLLAAPRASDDLGLVAMTDAVGRFTASALPAGALLTAEARGLQPARFVRVPAPATNGPSTVDFVLDAEAVSAEFLVQDEQGAPIAGAFVQVGWRRPPLAGNDSKLLQMRPSWTGTTDREGRVRSDSIAPDVSTAVFVRAPGKVAIQREFVPKAGGEPLLFRLAAGARIRGVLRDHNGPAPGIVQVLGRGITAGPVTPNWCVPSSLSNLDGSYELRGVPVGPVVVRAQHTSGVAEARFVLRAGEVIEWSPNFDDDGEVRGVVTGLGAGDHERLHVRLLQGGGPPLHAPVAADGKFRFGGLMDREFELLLLPNATGSGLVLQRACPVRPGAVVELALEPSLRPTATLRGRMADPSLRPPNLIGARGACNAELGADGAFEFRAVPPGRYHLSFGSGANAWFGAVELAADAVVDLGLLVVPTHTPVTIDLPGLQTEQQVELMIFSDDGVALLTLVRWRGRPAEFSLPPGRYQVQAWAGGVCVWTRAIAVDAAPLMLRSEPPPAAIVRLAALPMQPTSDFRVQWQVRGADGVHRSTSARPMDAAPTDAANLAIALPPGDYEVRASSLGGAEVVAQFTVPLPPGRQAPVLRLP